MGGYLKRIVKNSRNQLILIIESYHFISKNQKLNLVFFLIINIFKCVYNNQGVHTKTDESYLFSEFNAQ